MPGIIPKLTRHSALLLLTFAPSCLAAVTPWVDFELRGGHLHVDAVIDGYETSAILDTGASINGIDEAYLRDYGQDFNRGTRNDVVRITGIAGTFEKRLVFDVPVHIFGSTFDFDGLAPVSIDPAGLILGVDFFERSIVQIDYPNSRLRLIERESLNLKKLANVKTRRQPNGGSPTVRIRLNDEANLWIMLDTGATGGLILPRRYAKRNGWLDQFPTIEGRMVGVSGRPMVTETFNLPTLTIGPYTLEDVPVTVPGKGEKLAVDSGLLGYDILRHFQLTMDIKKKRLHIEAVDEIAETDAP
ncbi:MAG: aspartyl protease family protein [Gammaproteobacteria bacterium]